MKDILLSEIKPLYEKLLSCTPQDYGAFCMQWGQNFPLKSNEGILFVGRATNGWVTDSHDVEVLFGESVESIFNRPNQMKWWMDGNTNGYNINKSAFWRVIKGVASNYHPIEWYNNIAWSNLCKAAPFEGGNPSNKVYYNTLECNRMILSKEIEVLSPKIVVFLTRFNWAKNFITHINGDTEPKSFVTRDWSGYEANLYKIKDRYMIVSEHPQMKNEQTHIDAIISLIAECS